MRTEAIYKGATRPAMLLGVPLVPLVLLLGLTLLAAMWGGILVSGWLAVLAAGACAPALLWMRHVTHLDDQRFRQMAVAMRLRLFDHNRALWNGRSYTPHPYPGARDDWHV